MSVEIVTHRFLDEAGDTTFYLKGRKNAIGTPGVSYCFILGSVKISESINDIRNKIVELQNSIIGDPFLNEIPSILKKIRNTGYFLHATDDPPEVRMLFMKLIRNIDCSFEAIVLRKSVERFETLHNGKEEYFYADALAHLLKDNFESLEKLVLNISERGKCTKNINLALALEKAQLRFKEISLQKTIQTNIVFNVTNPSTEPLLNLSDYFCWTIQRVFERGDLRYYNYLKNKISLIVDVYDDNIAINGSGYYNSQNQLTAQNKICLH